MESLDQSKLTDHDILITLHNEVLHLGKDVASMKDDMNARVVALETKVDGLEDRKVSRTELGELIEAQKAQGRQIGRIMNYIFIAIGGLAVLQIVIQVYLGLHKS